MFVLHAVVDSASMFWLCFQIRAFLTCIHVQWKSCKHDAVCGLVLVFKASCFSRQLLQGRYRTAAFFFYMPFPPRDKWCDALGLMPTGSASSSLTLKILRRKPPHLVITIDLACSWWQIHQSLWSWASEVSHASCHLLTGYCKAATLGGTVIKKLKLLGRTWWN